MTGFAAPGSTAWLLRHELRLAWRGIGGRGLGLTLVMSLVLSALLHGAAYFILSELRQIETPGGGLLVIGGLSYLVMSFMLSQAITQSVTALFNRGDLDLLLSSPQPTRQIFMARGLGIAASVLVTYLFFLAPVAHMGLFTGHAELLALYPALVSFALLATAMGLWLTLALVQMLGARRARSAAQLIAVLMGALLYLVTQAGNLLNAGLQARWAAQFAQWAEAGGPLAPDSLLWWPARALVGEPLPLLVLAVIGVGAFLALVGLTHRRFLAGTQENVIGSVKRGAVESVRGTFRTGLARIVLFKEWRLILRDPQLISQTLLQLLYLIPLMFMPMHGEGHAFALVVPGAVMLAAQLAGNLAWITMAAEDAAELLGSSPNSQSRLNRLKLLAALLPVWLLLLPLALGLLFYGHWWAAAVLLFGLVGGTVSAGLTQLWYPRQGKRTDLKTRGKGQVGINTLELAIAVGWAGTSYCLITQPLWTPLPLLLALAGLGACWWMGRDRRAS